MPMRSKPIARFASAGTMSIAFTFVFIYFIIMEDVTMVYVKYRHATRSTIFTADKIAAAYIVMRLHLTALDKASLYISMQDVLL